MLPDAPNFISAIPALNLRAALTAGLADLTSPSPTFYKNMHQFSLQLTIMSADLISSM